ncbi:hypothetical protein F5Y08DRAFT_351905 [Xylaria arbuscula]|nr:hypothetical protein F5Y08DRAFT_351905 [Xylaria arbuscula]
MEAARDSTSSPKRPTLHPFDPATVEEIELATNIIQRNVNNASLHFKAAGLEEPSKLLVTRYLKAEHSFFEAIVDVTNENILYSRELSRDFHSPMDRVEGREAAKVAMIDDIVLDELARLKISLESVVTKAWDSGVDMEGTRIRRVQLSMFMQNPKNKDPDSSHYPFPLDFIVIVNLSSMKVESVMYISTGKNEIINPNRSCRQSNPTEPEYIPELQTSSARTGLKPYQIVQPDGASFRIRGHLVEWEKWRLRVGFH